MTTEEAITVLGDAKANAIERRLISESGGYGMGVCADGTFYWSYVCCEPDCEWNEFEKFSTLEELEDVVIIFEWQWKLEVQ